MSGIVNCKGSLRPGAQLGRTNGGTCSLREENHQLDNLLLPVSGRLR